MRSRTLIAFVLFAACGDDDATVRDAAVDQSRPDAVVLDGGFFLDMGSDTSAADSAVNDAGAPDSALACGGECRPDQEDCGGVVGTCVLHTAEPMCTSGAGTFLLGDACEETSQCRAGLACFRRRAGGVCGRICCAADPSACGEEELCTGVGVLVDGTETGYGECRAPRTCDLVSADSCESGEGCYLLGEEPGCAPAGTAERGESCESDTGCQPGFSCVGAFEGMCARNCRLRDPGGCPADEGECRAVANSPPGFGLCG